MAESAQSNQNNLSGRKVKGLLLGETLGKGTFGYVKLGIKQETGHKFALKFMKRNAKNFKESEVEKEIECLKKIRHKHVVGLLASSMKCKYPTTEGRFESTVLMVLEYCPNGDLYDVIYYSGRGMSEKLGRTYFQQMVLGLQAIHAAGVTHRDLKPNNILLDNKFMLKITDFGLSHIGPQAVNPNEKRMDTTWVGTKGYRAPELVLNRHYSNMCDVFALGVCLFVMLCARQPFKTAGSKDPWYKCIAAKQFGKYWKSHKSSNLSAKCKSLLQELLCYQPRDRITLAAALEHPWMQVEDNDGNPDIFNEAELIQEMHTVYQNSCEAKLNDKDRQKRLNNSQAGNEKYRSFGPTVGRFQSLMLDQIDFIERKALCMELKAKTNEHELFEKAIQVCEGPLEAKTDDIVFSNKGLLQADIPVETLDDIMGKYTVIFSISIVQFNDKKLFVVELKTGGIHYDLFEKISEAILDHTHAGLITYTPEQETLPEYEGYDFTQLEQEDVLEEETVEAKEEETVEAKEEDAVNTAAEVKPAEA